MDAKAYAARNRQGSDWFAHKSDSQIPAAQPQQPPQQQQSPPQQQQAHNNQDGAVVDPPASARTQMVRPVCNSNQWFKHGEQQNAATPKKEVEVRAETAAAAGERSTCASWCMGGGETKGQDVEHRSRSVTKDGEAYCIRDKAGSDWFSHDKSGDAGSQAVSTPRVGSVEGSHNATRMRGESENWFSHDPNAPAEPLHSSKGRPQSKALNSNMFNVFHHDQ